MENKKNRAIKQGKLILFDPNPSDNRVRATEDLSILVDLTTTRKGRSVISVDKSSKTGNLENSSTKSSEPIGFIDGSKVGAGKKALTTNYLEANSTLNVNGNNDLETLGIETINIDFDTAYTPIVKIKFVDIRGQSIFQQGNNSKYKMFFELPYPIFNLTIKGFFGQAVKYCLHLTKWNSSFNSQTGNFEIDAEFIGYTYALLTDMLMGYIRAVVYTPEGAPIWNKYKEEWAKGGKTLKTIDEMLLDIERLGDEFDKLKQDDTSVKELSESGRITEILDSVELQLVELTNDIVESQYFNNQKGVMAIPSAKYNITSNGKPSLPGDSLIKEKIDTYKTKIKNEFDGKDGINSEITNAILKLDTKLLTATNIITGFSGSSITIPQDGVTYLYSGQVKIEGDSFNNSEVLNDTNSEGYKYAMDFMETVLSLMPSNFNTENADTEIVLFDLRKAFLEIERVRTELKESNKTLRETIGNKLKQVAIDKLKFDPTIHNIFSILTVHCEVFLETLSKVSIEAESNTTRTEILSKFNTDGKIDTVFSWPEYKENKYIDKKELGYHETWIGSALNQGEKLAVNEVKFIENLLEQLLNLVKKDDELINLGNGVEGPQFWPLKPLDTPVFVADSQIKSNPYKEAIEGVGTAGKPEEVTRLLLMRGFLGLSDVTMDGLNVKTKGRFEADNLFDVLNKQKRATASNLINSLKDISKDGPASAQAAVISTWTNGTDKVKNPPNTGGSLLRPGKYKGDDVYFYHYIGSGSNGTGRWYLPISSGFDGIDFYDENKKLKKESDLKIQVSPKILYTSNHNNSLQNVYPKGNHDFFDFDDVHNMTEQPFYDDDGSVYLKIMSIDEYEGNYMDPSFGQSTIASSSTYRGDTNVPENAIIKQSTFINAIYHGDESRLAILNPYTSRYKVQEIINYNYDGIEAESGGDRKGEQAHYPLDGVEPTIGNVLCSYWHDMNDNYVKFRGGTFLSKEIDNEFSKNYRDNFLLDFSKPSDTKVFELGTGAHSTFFAKQGGVKDDFGKQRELIGHIYGDIASPDSSSVNIPFIEFSLSNDEDFATDNISLLGSQFYYEQDEIGKAFLFLHSFSWAGMVGDILDDESEFLGGTVSSSLFDTFKKDGDSFEEWDDTPNLKALFGINSSFIKAPKLWCAFLGGLISRYDNGLVNEKDMIKFYTKWDYLLPFQDADTYTPRFYQLFHDVRSISQRGMNFVSSSNQKDEWLVQNTPATRDDIEDNEKYAHVDRVLLGLPQQVRNEFKRVFNDFVTDYNTNLAPQLEIFNYTTNSNTGNASENLQKDYEEGTLRWNKTWDDLNSDLYNIRHKVGNYSGKTFVAEPYRYFGTTQDVIDTLEDNGHSPNKEAWTNYSRISPAGKLGYINPLGGNKRRGMNLALFNLELKNNSPAVNIIKRMIKETYVIANSNPKLFRANKPVGVVLTENTPPREPLAVKKADMDEYLKAFFLRFDELAKDWNENKNTDEDDLQNRLFNTIDDDMIKLSLYRSMGSIHNKWIAGTDNPLQGCSDSLTPNQMDKESSLSDRDSVTPHFIDSFRFLDRAFNNIGDKFYLNPLAVSKLIVGNYNQSFFDVADKTLTDNNFNFIALPTFLNFNDVTQMEKMFDPYTYKEVAGGNLAAGPSFVCVYVGQTSTSLDLGADSQYKDDGVVVQVDSKGKIINVPEDFIADKAKDGSLNIPLFMVRYGQQNQSYFKDIKLDQREFVETAESLQIIEDISQQGDNRRPNFNGQNLFNVYQTRSYSAEIEMMGNAMIQPMMYFQLDNIPMFKGAYLIIKVTHTINAHQMTTKFKGTRIKKTKTPLIEASTLFMNLLGSLEGLNSNGIAGPGLGSGVRHTNTQIDQVAKWVDTPIDVNMLPITKGTTKEKINGSTGTKMQTSSSLRKYGMREVVETLQYSFNEFHKGAKGKPYNDTVYLGELSVDKGGILSPSHASHQIGVDIDIRQIVHQNNSAAASVTFEGNMFSNPAYALNGNLSEVKQGESTTKTLNLWDTSGDTRDVIQIKELKAKYSRSGTRALIKQLISDSGTKAPGTIVDGAGIAVKFATLDVIYFNDPVLIAEFTIVQAMTNHDHHLHIRYKIPERVLRENKKGEDPNGQNTRMFNN